MNKIFLIEENYPNISVTKDGLVTNENTGRVLKIKTDGCFEVSLKGKRKAFSLNKILAKYFIEPGLKLTPIPGFEGEYSATEEGQIYSHNRAIFLSPSVHPTGYLHLRLGRQSWYVHRIVALTFIPNPNNLPEVNHKDENKLNCRVDNLEWCSRKYNVNYGTRNKRVSEINKVVMQEWWVKRKAQEMSFIDII